MLNNQLEAKKSHLEIKQKLVELCFDSQARYCFELKLPSEDEVKAAHSNIVPALSVRGLESENYIGWGDGFRQEYSRQLIKYESYKNSAVFLSRLSSLAAELGEDDESRMYLEEAKTLSPENLFLKHKLGNLLIDNEKYEEALKLLTRSDLEIDSYANLQKAKICMNNSDIETAQSYVFKALEIDNTNYEARLFAGTLSIYHGEWERAIRHYRVALEESNKSSPLMVNMAYSYWMLGEFEKAERNLKKALLINPLNKNAVIFYSDVCKYRNKPIEAISFLEFYLEYEQKDETAWERLGLAYYESGKEYEKLEYFRNSLEALKMQNTLSSNPGVWNNIALNNWKLGNHSLASRYLAQSIKKSEEENNLELMVTALYNLSLVLIDAKKYGELREILNEYLKVFTGGNIPENRLFDYLMLFHVQAIEGSSGQDESAKEIVHILKSHRISENNVRYELYNRLLVYISETSDDKEKAYTVIEKLTRVIENRELVSPMLWLSIVNNVAFFSCNSQELEKAEYLLNLLPQEIHSNAYLTATFGLLNIKKGRLKKGEALYREAISMIPDHKTKQKFKQRLNYELGNVYFVRNDYVNAQRLLSTVLKTKEGNKYLVERSKSVLLGIKHDKLIH
ncbi:MAG: hypothetical protein HQ498_02370 [Pseudohongiella sp.]|nr:hypothetical protein [Pseudohongiella sp.]